MTRNKFKKLRLKLAQMRHSPQKADALQKFAGQLGRRLASRGKEPTWVSDRFPQLRPLSIPDHGNRDVAPGTKNSILNQLEDDLNSWDEQLTKQEEEAETKDMK
jgi:hypothetical protein